MFNILNGSLSSGIVHGINETEVTHVVTSRHLLAKLVPLQNKIPRMKMIIYFDSDHNKSKEEPIKGTNNGSSLKLIALSELERMAKESTDTDVLLEVQQSNEDDIAVLLYTSGNWISIMCKNQEIKTATNFRLDWSPKRGQNNTQKLLEVLFSLQTDCRSHIGPKGQSAIHRLPPARTHSRVSYRSNSLHNWSQDRVFIPFDPYRYEHWHKRR